LYSQYEDALHSLEIFEEQGEGIMRIISTDGTEILFGYYAHIQNNFCRLGS